MNYPRLSILILAAGASTRLGRAKQLVRYKTGTLIQNAVNVAHSISPGEIIVVTGAHAEAVRKSVRQPSVRWVHNPRWSDGMGGSIATGIAAVNPGSSAAMILLCDQWRIETPDLRVLTEVWQSSPERIVCAQAGGKTMPPVIFPANLFSRLEALKGDRGARGILTDHPGMLTPVSMQNAAWDLDLESQLDQFKPV